MKLVIHGKHLSVTPAIRQYVEEKVGRVEKYFDKILEIDVTLSAEKLKTGPHHTVEALVFINGLTVKGSSTDTDLYAAIDEVADVLQGQIKKFKERKRDDAHTGSLKNFSYNPETKTVSKSAERAVVSSTLDTRPMSLEEAILQLECLDKPFYAFVNSETGEMNVVYYRNNKDYGHIEPGKK